MRSLQKMRAFSIAHRYIRIMEMLGYLCAGIVAGAAAGWFAALFFSSKKKNDSAAAANVAEQQTVFLAQQLDKSEREVAALNEQLRNMQGEWSGAQKESENLRARLDDQKKELEELNKKFTTEFENVANKLLESKSEKFTKQNKEQLDLLLQPLSERIKEFEKKVDDTYKEEVRERASLKQQIITLAELNQTMNKQAENLTRALKGDSKTQGNWGEMILEKILERSGLQRDREYVVQQSMTNDEGKRFQPDVVIHLPDEKHLVVDSKVSLTAYEQFCSADDEEARIVFLAQHLLSIRAHMKGLGEKNYQSLYGLASLDFVLMFIPIEPAFGLATQGDNSLWNDAYDRNIIIVSPTTLLATMRTIANIWKQEKQNANWIEIARLGGVLYEKLSNFTQDMISVGKKMDDAKKNYEDAMNKLSTGKGNAIITAEKLKELGIKTEKKQDQQLLLRAGVEENEKEE